MNPSELPELDDLLEESLEGPMTAKELRTWNAGVHSRIADDLDSLLADAAKPKPVWNTIAQVVLIQEQPCTTCSNVAKLCQGWFTSQTHSTDPFAKRMLAGKPAGKYPVRMEVQRLPPVDICPNCAGIQVEYYSDTREAH